MTTTSAHAERTAPSTAGPRALVAVARGWEQHPVLLIALATVVLRLPFLAADPSRDEAGFLLVGAQWHRGGTSLYGDYWVDRPPLLVTIYRLASQLGGLVPLRLIGCVAAALVVLGTAHVARRLAGPRAAPWAALTAAALSVTPLLGTQSVNGELLAAPFVVGGLAAMLAALDQPALRRATVAAALAGAATTASLLVKQNMADVAVFALVALCVAWRRGEISTSRLVRVTAGAAVGAVAFLAVMALWTLAHGTSLTGVYDAMYPFRVEAGQVLAASNRTSADARSRALVVCWVASGGALIMLLVARALLSRRARSAAVWALLAVVVFDVASISVGGSYWNHYLIQLVVPMAILSGVLVAQRRPLARPVLGLTAVAAVVALGFGLAAQHTTAGTSVGRAIGAAARPQDTIVTTWGHADVTRATGLDSPYPYLWALPARTLDPRLAELDALLAGPDAPTWFVAWTSVGSWPRLGGGAVATALALAAHYTPVAQVDGHTVYLHRGIDRPTPQLGARDTELSSSQHLSLPVPVKESP